VWQGDEQGRLTIVGVVEQGYMPWAVLRRHCTEVRCVAFLLSGVGQPGDRHPRLFEAIGQEEANLLVTAISSG
jgi:hypothetical protein